MLPRLLTRPIVWVFISIALSLSALTIMSQSLTTAQAARLQSNIIVNPGSSIQAAINAAHPGDTIVINPGTYNESLTLSKAVNLTGVNSATVIINALPNQRVLMVSGSTINNSVVISGFTIANGNVTGGNNCPAYCGGGVLITGTAQPQLWNLIVTNNRAGSQGGGLYADGSLTLNHIRFVSNTVQQNGSEDSIQYGGGASIQGTAVINDSYFERNACIATIRDWGCLGGGLSAINNLIINNSQFLSNTINVGLDIQGAGAGVWAGYDGQSDTINNSLFQNNRCPGGQCEGGGLYTSAWILQAIDTVFINNQATNGAGVDAFLDIVLTQDRFEANQSSWDGGGLYSGSSSPSSYVTATNTIFISNSARNGGGFYAGNATIVGGRFENNNGYYGGGLRADQAGVTGTFFLNNVAQQGGGLEVDQSGRIVNAVFAGNSDSGYAAAILALGNTLEILHTTITSPTLATGPAIRADSGMVGITDTIITSHTLGVQQNASSVVYEDYDLFFSDTSNFSGTVSGDAHDVFSDPSFANPTIDNYHIISPSAAIDAGINAGVTTDLDGIPRPIGAGYDMGAYEYVNWTNHVYLPLVLKNH